MTVVDILRKFADASPGRPACLLFDGSEDEVISYGDLCRNAARAAAALRASGVKRGDVVLLSMNLSKELLYFFWGAIFSGAVPVLFAGPDLIVNEYYLRNMFSVVREHGIRWVLLDESFRRKNRRSLARASRQAACRILSSRLGPARKPFFAPARADDPLLAQLTSGTSGLQKLCRYDHRQILLHVRRMQHAFRGLRDPVVVNWLPLYHDLGLMDALLFPLLSGIPSVHIPPRAFLRSPSVWFDALNRHRGAITWAPNFAFRICSERIPEDAAWDLSHVQRLINGSEPVSLDGMKAFYKKFSRFGLKRRALRVSYGTAECPGVATMAAGLRSLTVGRAAMETARKKGYSWSRDTPRSRMDLAGVGRPLRGVRVRVRDEKGRTLQEGRIGRVFLKTDSAWFETHDIGTLSKGELFLLGRDSEIINIAGLKYVPSEIERVAVNGVPGIRKGCNAIFGIYDTWSGTERLVVLAEAYAATKGALKRMRREIRRRISAAFALACYDIVILPKGTLKKTTSGKKRHLGERARFLRGEFDRFRG